MKEMGENSLIFYDTSLMIRRGDKQMKYNCKFICVTEEFKALWEKVDNNSNRDRPLNTNTHSL
jgi:hypothetical protein